MAPNTFLASFYGGTVLASRTHPFLHLFVSYCDFGSRVCQPWPVRDPYPVGRAGRWPSRGQHMEMPRGISEWDPDDIIGAPGSNRA